MKKITKEMFDVLISLYRSDNINRKVVLRNKFIQMSRSNSIIRYFMKITQVCD